MFSKLNLGTRGIVQTNNQSSGLNQRDNQSVISLNEKRKPPSSQSSESAEDATAHLKSHLCFSVVFCSD